MSLLIKGMKMPKRGFVDVRIFHDGRATTATADRPFYKEMVVAEVPTPHGRLIDADALAKDYDGFPVRIDPWVWNELSHAPTIIEAEEETDGET